MKHEPNPLKKPADDNAKLAQAQCAAHIQVVTTPIVDSIRIRGMDFTLAEARTLYRELGELFDKRPIFGAATYSPPNYTPPTVPYWTSDKIQSIPNSVTVMHNCEKGNW